MKLVEFQHLSGSSMCPVVWFREEFEIKCPDRQAMPPQASDRCPPVYHRTKTHMPVTGAFAEDPAFHGPVGFHSFQRSKKI